MRRASIAMAAGGAGLALVVGLHPGKPATIKPKAAKGVVGPPSATPTTTTPPSGAPGVPRTATGIPENYGYGTLTVSVTATGGHIVGVSVAHLQTIDPYSQALADQVIPMLRQQVMDAQSANIQGVSGATYTSEAYAYSLQAALSRLGLQ